MPVARYSHGRGVALRASNVRSRGNKLNNDRQNRALASARSFRQAGGVRHLSGVAWSSDRTFVRDVKTNR
jgi:hypothetical protein